MTTRSRVNELIFFHLHFLLISSLPFPIMFLIPNGMDWIIEPDQFGDGHLLLVKIAAIFGWKTAECNKI